MIKAVIFDLDGTLLDTLADIGGAVNQSLAELGLEQHPLDAYRYFVGDGFHTLIHRAVPEAHRSENTLASALAGFRRHYAQMWNLSSKPYPGIADMLNALNRQQIPLAVLSNKAQNFTEQIMQTIFAPWNFALIFGQRDGIPVKPDPVSALEIAGALKLSPAEIAYVGDTSVDMQTAVAAGMYPIGVLWGFRDRTELESSGAQAIVSEPQELLSLLDSKTASAT